MKTIIAIYEDGVFRPEEPVDLPEHSRVLLQVEKGHHRNGDSSQELELLGYRGALPWPAPSDHACDLKSYIGSLSSGSADPVEWQRRVRDEEWT